MRRASGLRFNMLRALAVCLAGFAGRVSADSPPQALSEAEMKMIYGGDGCKNCQWDSSVIDECYHTGGYDTCGTDKCIHNVLEEATCNLGSGTCTAYSDPNLTSGYQEVRSDTNCQNMAPTGWYLWVRHYYGSTCMTVSHYTRCVKTNAPCDGTIISTVTHYPGIRCP